MAPRNIGHRVNATTEIIPNLYGALKFQPTLTDTWTLDTGLLLAS